MRKLRLTPQSAQRLRDVLQSAPKSPARASRDPLRFDVRIVRCVAEEGTSPQVYYTGNLRVAEDLTTKANAGTATVILADLNGAPLTPDRDYLAIRGGDESDVPVYWTLSGGGSGAGACGSGCGTLAGLIEDWALLPELVCAVGEFAGINTTQLDVVFMRNTAANTWTAQSWNSTSEAWENASFNYVGGSGTPVFNSVSGTLAIGNTTMRTLCLEADGTFVGGPGVGFDGNTTLRSALAVCDPNDFILRLSCICEPIDGFTEDEKWYCIVGSSENCVTDIPTAVILSIADGSACNTSIQICDGPFDTEAEAEAACLGGALECCEDRLGAATLTATLSGGEGTMSLTWDTVSRWTGSKALSCGETLYLRYGVDCTLDFSCDGANFIPASRDLTALDCGPPLSDGVYTCNMDDVAAGCSAGSCGSITVTVSE